MLLLALPCMTLTIAAGAMFLANGRLAFGAIDGDQGSYAKKIRKM